MQSVYLTGFIVARYFSFMMASFSVSPRNGILYVLLFSCSICISRLREREREGGRERERGREGGREGEREREGVCMHEYVCVCVCMLHMYV